MGFRVVWAITGAGHGLRKLFWLLYGLKREEDFSFTVVLSRAGREVARIYGVLDKMPLIAGGGRYEEVFEDNPTGYPVAGRLMMGRYDALLIAPASGNTVAKIAHGIADNIVTTSFAMAQKSGIPIIVMPTEIGATETELPCMVEEEACTGCGLCINVCPARAIRMRDRKALIDLNRCRGCEICTAVCPYGAVKCWSLARVAPREIDLRNLELLRGMEGVNIVGKPYEAYLTLKELARLKSTSH